MLKYNIFISYCHCDDHKLRFKDAFVQYLGQALACQEISARVSPWNDDQPEQGSDWEQEIISAIEHSVAAVLFVSQAFWNSSYIIAEEVPRILKQRDEAGLIVLPVIVDRNTWQEHAWLAQAQARPTHGRLLDELHERERADLLQNIAQRAAKLVFDAEREDLSAIEAVFRRLAGFHSANVLSSEAHVAAVNWLLDANLVDVPGSAELHDLIRYQKRLLLKRKLGIGHDVPHFLNAIKDRAFPEPTPDGQSVRLEAHRAIVASRLDLDLEIRTGNLRLTFIPGGCIEGTVIAEPFYITATAITRQQFGHCDEDGDPLLPRTSITAAQATKFLEQYESLMPSIPSAEQRRVAARFLSLTDAEQKLHLKEFCRTPDGLGMFFTDANPHARNPYVPGAEDFQYNDTGFRMVMPWSVFRSPQSSVSIVS